MDAVSKSIYDFWKENVNGQISSHFLVTKDGDVIHYNDLSRRPPPNEPMERVILLRLPNPTDGGLQIRLTEEQYGLLIRNAQLVRDVIRTALNERGDK